MATYISLINFTEQGIENIKDSTTRLDDAQALARSLGGEMSRSSLPWAVTTWSPFSNCRMTRRPPGWL